MLVNSSRTCVWDGRKSQRLPKARQEYKFCFARKQREGVDREKQTLWPSKALFFQDRFFREPEVDCPPSPSPLELQAWSLQQPEINNNNNDTRGDSHEISLEINNTNRDDFHEISSSRGPGTTKLVAAERLRPADVAAISVRPEDVTDVFIDFDGTLTVKSDRAHEYLLPLLRMLPGQQRVSDSAYPDATPGVMSWADVDAAMAECVPRAELDFSETSVMGSAGCRVMLQQALLALKSQGVRLHLLTMGTPQTHKALLLAAGLDVSLFEDWLGPTDMARAQGLKHLFDSNSGRGFQFTVEQDIAALETVRNTAFVPPLIHRIMSMETRLSKADLLLQRAGKGGVLVDDNWARNLFDAKEKGAMYMHVGPEEGVASTAKLLASLALEILAARA
ncbi:unnamed protein product [Polarella glacialis]|uniref:Uncharacterized protein n=1 Tax=Polarella glacialis TaxID=89957 RepID=A0A813HEX1_POLGL|nr:unnamed protein product [Polarella glacialis]